MTNKRRKEEPPASSSSDQDSTPFSIPHIQVERSRNSRRDNSRRYDSGIHSGVGDSLGDDELASFLLDTPFEELEDVFDAVDQQEALIVDSHPFSTSTPNNSRPSRLHHHHSWSTSSSRTPGEESQRLAPPHDFHRENGVLTPRSYQRLRCISEGSNEDFQEEFTHGVLSHPDIQADVIAIRLGVIANQLNNHYYRSSSAPASLRSLRGPTPRTLTSRAPLGGEDSRALEEIAERLSAFGTLIDNHYFRKPTFIQTHQNLLFGCVAAAAVAYYLYKRW